MSRAIVLLIQGFHCLPSSCLPPLPHAVRCLPCAQIFLALFHCKCSVWCGHVYRVCCKKTHTRRCKCLANYHHHHLLKAKNTIILTNKKKIRLIRHTAPAGRLHTVERLTRFRGQVPFLTALGVCSLLCVFFYSILKTTQSEEGCIEECATCQDITSSFV